MDFGVCGKAVGTFSEWVELMKFGKKVSLIIPTLNEGKNIAKVLEGVPFFVDEVIVVDGNSTDGTYEIAERHGCIVLGDGIGKGAAIIKGVKKSTGKFIVIMDGDQSHRPKEMSAMIEKLAQGYDICLASRFIRGGRTNDMSLVRAAGNAFFVWIVNSIWSIKLTDLCYGYRALRKNSFDSLQLKSRGFSIDAEMTIQAVKHDLKIIEVPSFEKKRRHGKGKLRPLADGLSIIRTIMREAVTS